MALQAQRLDTRPVWGQTTRITGPFGLNPDAAGYNEAIGGMGQSAMTASGNMANALASQYNAFAPSVANAYGTYGDTVASAGNNYAQMFDSYARNAGQYFNAVGNIAANAMAAQQNANQDRFSAYAQGNNAYQNLLGSLGTAALAGYGSAANAAMQAQAMNSTAALKAMADAMGQNQQATATYGVGRNQALAGLAAALSGAGTGFANARAANSAAASRLGADGAAAYSNLGSALGTAAGNLGASAGQSQAALRSALANALSGVSQAESAGLSGIGSSANTALAGLAPSMQGAAQADLNYTRDMAKLGLARELGLVGTNAMGSMGGDFGGGDVTISGPDGFIAGGGFGGGTGGGGGGFRYVDPYSNTPWYATRQDAGGAGLSALGGLQRGIAQNAAERSAGLIGSADATRANLARESAAGGLGLGEALTSGMAQIGAQGDAARGGIGSALAGASRQIDDSALGIDRDAGSTFSGLERTRGDIMSGDVLASLNANFGSGMGMLQDAFARGQQDPRSIYDSVIGNITGLLNPLVQRGTDAMGQFYGNFPDPVTVGAGGQLDPNPYLNALSQAYDPFMANLNTTLDKQNALVAGGVGGAGTRLDGVVRSMTNELGKGRGAVGSLFNESVGRMFDAFDGDPVKAAQQANEVAAVNERGRVESQLRQVQRQRASMDSPWLAQQEQRLMAQLSNFQPPRPRPPRRVSL